MHSNMERTSYDNRKEMKDYAPQRINVNMARSRCIERRQRGQREKKRREVTKSRMRGGRWEGRYIDTIGMYE